MCGEFQQRLLGRAQALLEKESGICSIQVEVESQTGTCEKEGRVSATEHQNEQKVRGLT